MQSDKLKATPCPCCGKEGQLIPEGSTQMGLRVCVFGHAWEDRYFQTRPVPDPEQQEGLTKRLAKLLLTALNAGRGLGSTWRSETKAALKQYVELPEAALASPKADPKTEGLRVALERMLPCLKSALMLSQVKDDVSSSTLVTWGAAVLAAEEALAALASPKADPKTDGMKLSDAEIDEFSERYSGSDGAQFYGKTVRALCAQAKRCNALERELHESRKLRSVIEAQAKGQPAEKCKECGGSGTSKTLFTVSPFDGSIAYHVCPRSCKPAEKTNDQHIEALGKEAIADLVERHVPVSSPLVLEAAYKAVQDAHLEKYIAEQLQACRWKGVRGMKMLTVKLSYGESEFTTIVRSPASANEYLEALAHLALGINEVAEKWSADARREHWELQTEARTTVEEF